MIKIENLSFSYGETPIFENFSLEIPDKVSVLSGPSGCGKTTLLRILAGLEKPQGGSISGVGTVSYMFQENRLIPTLSALKNVEIVMGQPNSSIAHLWLQRVGLGAEAGSLPSELSGGQQRRVALARALAFGGDTLILDEPLTGLDPELVREMVSLILEQSARVIAVTHSENEKALFGGRSIDLGNM